MLASLKMPAVVRERSVNQESLQVPSLDALIVPVSGGGMISGISVAAKGLKPGITIIAAEPTGARQCHVLADLALCF